MLVGRSSSSISGHELEVQSKKSQPPSEGEESAVLLIEQQTSPLPQNCRLDRGSEVEGPAVLLVEPSLPCNIPINPDAMTAYFWPYLMPL
jgi:hypothetical protein